MQIAKLSEHHLTAAGRKILPLWHKRFANVPPLFGSHLFQNALALQQRLPLLRREVVPVLEPLANSRLLLERQAAEACVIVEELLLFGGRHLLQALNPPRWQTSLRFLSRPRYRRALHRRLHARTRPLGNKTRGRQTKRRCQHSDSEWTDLSHEPGSLFL